MDAIIEQVRDQVPGVSDDAIVAAIADSGIEPEDMTDGHVTALIKRLSGGLTKSRSTLTKAKPQRPAEGLAKGSESAPSIAAPSVDVNAAQVSALEQLQDFYRQGAQQGALGVQAFAAGRNAALAAGINQVVSQPIALFGGAEISTVDWEGVEIVIANPWEAE